MRKLSLTEITQKDSRALISFIDYWKDYEKYTVLFSYAELKNRNYILDEKLQKQLNKFCVKNNAPDIESFLSAALKDIGYDSYDDCIGKEFDDLKKNITAQNASSANGIEDAKYPALRTISVIYKFFGWLIIISTLIVVFVLGQESGISALITVMIGMLIVLGVFAVAELIMVFIDIESNTRTSKKNNDLEL